CRRKLRSNGKRRCAQPEESSAQPEAQTAGVCPSAGMLLGEIQTGRREGNRSFGGGLCRSLSLMLARRHKEYTYPDERQRECNHRQNEHRKPPVSEPAESYVF